MQRDIGERKSRHGLNWNGALDKSDVAAIPYADVAAMTREELIRVVKAADLPMLGPRIRNHLAYQSREVLERLAHSARRSCRSQGY